MVNANYGVPSTVRDFLKAPAPQVKNYTYVDLLDGIVKACTEEQAFQLCRCEDYYVITPDGDWLDIDAQVREVDRG